jgi:hypothetical protein
MTLRACASRTTYRLLFIPQVFVITAPVEILRGDISTLQHHVNMQPLPGLESQIFFATVGVCITIQFSVIGVAWLPTRG